MTPDQYEEISERLKEVRSALIESADPFLVVAIQDLDRVIEIVKEASK
jgi:hypothetical protein